MSEHRRRTRRMQAHTWDGEGAPSAPTDPPQEDSAQDTVDWGEDPVNRGGATPEASEPSESLEDSQPPEEPQPDRRERLIIGMVVALALIAAVILGVMIYRQNVRRDDGAGAAPTAIPYDATQPFLPADITAEQMEKIEAGGGSFALMDYETGPHGIQIGDTLDTLLSRFPVTSTQSAQDDYAWDEEGDNMTYLTYDYLETDYQVIYAERVFYREGEMIVLPPSGTLSVSSDMIIVTLTAPVTPYPEGTAENYMAYPHVYCKLTIDPDTSRITRIVLGRSE